ncbi:MULTISPECIES: coproporphyrinogen-III oxidase family protein [Streptomyces]|uniref:coproporphyrinogen-III oxidase family protein n=1 Tax=Streptomyces TaxID=1883 RepID=UPI000A388635|nr:MULTISPECIES: radical SAM protein [Streptomyces]MDX3630110.1 radical SAM protein [Streptomyces europaeiscabiei]MDX3652363.1 radical SAM protein [Streptomyces europaeiscabiei]
MVKLLPGKTLMKFDEQFPVYNWLYPMKGQELDVTSHDKLFPSLDVDRIRDRALYFHIPFCETICSFCTLNRGLGKPGDEAIELYVQALIREIQIKAKYESVTCRPIKAIFFGGGTPTTLTAGQIRRIGKAIHDHFDMSVLEEFTFEMEVKSIDEEKIVAMRDIGVNKARFGLQTFDPVYRELFNITATLDQTYEAAALLRRYFDYTSFDIIYGMHGQTIEQFSREIQSAVDLGTETIEFYPITNVVTQASLHHGYVRNSLAPLSFMNKMAMSIYLNQYIRASGFQQHNGNGFYRIPDGEQPDPNFISRDYTNLYNSFFWSHSDDDLIGFGNSSISQTGAYTIMNDENRATYTRNLLDKSDFKINVTQADGIPYEKSLVFRLPFFGWVPKSRLEWERIPQEFKDKLGNLIAEGLVVEEAEEFRITELGWYWYVNMMYYMSPASDQKILDDFVALKSRVKGITDGERRMTLPVISA